MFVNLLKMSTRIVKSEPLRESVVVFTHAVGELQLSRNESISLRAMLISPGS